MEESLIFEWKISWCNLQITKLRISLRFLVILLLGQSTSSFALYNVLRCCKLDEWWWVKGLLDAFNRQPQDSWMLCPDWTWPWLKCCFIGNNCNFRFINRWVYNSQSNYYIYKILARWYGSIFNSCLCFCARNSWWQGLWSSCIYCLNAWRRHFLTFKRSHFWRYRTKNWLFF